MFTSYYIHLLFHLAAVDIYHSCVVVSALIKNTSMAQINDNTVNDAVVPDDAALFPDDEVMPPVDERVNAIYPWRDVAKFIYHRILSIRSFTKKDGCTSVILTLQRRSGLSFEVWATSLIARDIDNKMDEANRQEQCLYIKSLGLKKAKNNRDYYSYVFYIQ